MPAFVKFFKVDITTTCMKWLANYCMMKVKVGLANNFKV